MFQEIKLVVDEEKAKERLDVFLSSVNLGLSRSHVQKLLTEDWIKVNEKKVKAGYKIKMGDVIDLLIPPPLEMTALPENIPLDIYYEDEDLLVINKPKGMVIHPAEGNYSGTLVNALLYHCQDLSGINGVLRPGIVHRLDKDTSGLLMVAKNDKAHQFLAEQLKERKVTRRYLALVHGKVKNNKGIIDAPLGRDTNNRQKIAVQLNGGRFAVTHYKVLQRYSKYTYLNLRLETGRTHQIRVHMSYIGYPLVGDPKYGFLKNNLSLEGQFLHAAILGFIHPRSGKEMIFEAPLPVSLQEILNKLEPLKERE